VHLQARKMLIIDLPRNPRFPYQAGQFQKSHAAGAILALQQYLELNFGERISLEQMAAVASLEPRTLLRRFRSATGDSPVRSIRQLIKSPTSAAKRSMGPAAARR
jgi:transcriptional regulator GlxA family with amidase domain